ncbi:MAG: nucleoside-diphosphate kinase [Actinomycetota bacterium]
MADERTLVLVKPDGVRRRLIGEVIRRLEAKGLSIVAMRMLTMDTAMAGEHYAEHKDKPFFSDLVSFITGGSLVAMAVEGDEAVSVGRTLMGATDPKKAALGTIRGDLAIEMTENIVHGSDSPASAKRELALFFPDIG